MNAAEVRTERQRAEAARTTLSFVHFLSNESLRDRGRRVRSVLTARTLLP